MRIILTAIALIVTLGAGAQTQSDLREMQKLNQFMRYLTGTYVDTLNTPKLVETAITQMLLKLDPHSAYISAEEMKAVNENFDGNFEGIGIEFNVLNDTLIVVNTIPGGPSEKVGLLPNDRIIAVNDSTVVGIRQSGVPKVLRGPKGTVVNVLVVRRGVSDKLNFRIVRDKIPIYTVDAAYKVNDKTGYVRINRFAATTNDELQQALAKMKGIDALILDLRGNGGGYLEQAVSVSNNFLKRGSLIVSTEGRVVPQEKMFAPKDPTFEKGKLVILVDEFSASASEIVAGAVQDWDRGVIIGHRTFGKGLVQRQFPFADGSTVRITVARYHTPSGRAIQRRYEEGESKKYYEDFSQRLNTDSVEAPSDTTIYKTLIKGRTVYGGGGITPDITVARDTSFYSTYWLRLRQRSVINDYVIDYMDKNRSRLEREFPDFNHFEKGFTVDDSMFSALTELGEKRGIEYDEAGMKRSRQEIGNQIKALIAQKLWTTSEYFEVINRSDDVFLRAMDELGRKP